MSLVLAIQPDRVQAERLHAVIYDRVDADVIIGTELTAVFDAAGGRAPDLILVSSLLSSSDQDDLDARLTAYRTDAHYVETLTIPLLADPDAPAPVAESGGLFARLRRKKPQPQPTAGSDPGLFAAQVKEYLERCASERALTTASGRSLHSEIAGTLQKIDVLLGVAAPPEAKAAEAPLPSQLPSQSAPRRPAGASRAMSSAKRPAGRPARPKAKKPRELKRPPDPQALFDPGKCDFAALVDAFDTVVEDNRQQARADEFLERFS